MNKNLIMEKPHYYYGFKVSVQCQQNINILTNLSKYEIFRGFDINSQNEDINNVYYFMKKEITEFISKGDQFSVRMYISDEKRHIMRRVHSLYTEKFPEETNFVSDIRDLSYVGTKLKYKLDSENEETK